MLTHWRYCSLALSHRYVVLRITPDRAIKRFDRRLSLSRLSLDNNNDRYLNEWHSLAEQSGPWFNIKMSSYQYRKSHGGDKTILRPVTSESMFYIVKARKLSLVSACKPPMNCFPKLDYRSQIYEGPLLIHLIIKYLLNTPISDNVFKF